MMSPKRVAEIIAARDSDREEIARLRAEVARLREALEFYADPETYHAINIYADPPCGAFRDDFGPHGHWFYEREMPGKRARAALEGGET